MVHGRVFCSVYQTIQDNSEGQNLKEFCSMHSTGKWGYNLSPCAAASGKYCATVYQPSFGAAQWRWQSLGWVDTSYKNAHILENFVFVLASIGLVSKGPLTS